MTVDVGGLRYPACDSEGCPLPGVAEFDATLKPVQMRGKQVRCTLTLCIGHLAEANRTGRVTIPWERVLVLLEQQGAG